MATKPRGKIALHETRDLIADGKAKLGSPKGPPSVDLSLVEATGGAGAQQDECHLP